MFNRAKQKEQGDEPRRIDLRIAFSLLALTLLAGMILKAVDDVRSTRASIGAITDREALAVSEYISGKADGVSLTLAHAYRSGWGARQTAQSHPDIESVVGLADALSAPEGSRARAAGEIASQLLVNQSRVGQSTEGDLVVVFEAASGATRIALVQTGRWVPQANGQRVIELRSSILANQPLQRVSACKTIDAGLYVCVTNEAPILTRAVLLEWLGFFLLLLSPGLVILGLWQWGQKRRSESEVLEGEATKAGRLLGIVQKETSSGYWTWNEQTQKLWLSEPAASLLGVIAGGYYTSTHLLEQVHEDHVELLRRVIETLPERDYLAQTFANKDMSLWLDMRASRDPRTNELHGVLIDVTLTRRAIQRSQQAERRLKSSIEGFSGPFAIWDRNRRLLYWNSAFSDVFGLASSLRVGMSYETVTLAQASGIRERRGDGREGGANIIRAQDNDWYKIVERMTPTGGMITVGLNVTADVQNEVQIERQRKQLETLVIDLKTSQAQAAELTQNLKIERDRAEKSAASKSAFLANMSHELRTPLNAIIGFSEIMRDESFGPLGHEKYGEYAVDILSSGQHLLDMINDILDMAKIEAGKMTVALEPIDIVEPVDVAVRMVRRRAEEKGLQLDLVADDDLPAIDADHRAIRQMVLNLVSNAIKFTDKGGAIRVMVNRQGREVRVAVRDSGIGIPAEALPRLAQPFEQVADTRDRNYHGTGLGLSLTKSFAELHGGRLSIASEEGKGTMVSFYLPLPQGNGVTAAA
ncbi:ATP-binding protein [Hyphomonas sp. FCG-A18]|uniref:PAS domain-containing sensor histidine kinase n=1 Tax=Hyphomonas sp. FCG-A18 TaxID=3080019 RepID=UPI002B2D6321|nr:ATP-binding protein [Hyphomonas sp. FCG-A18]